MSLSSVPDWSVPKTAGRSHATYKEMRERLKRELPPVCFCGKWIDRKLRYPHPMSWSLDHIIPLSVRPDLAHVESNMRPAHLRCNSRRGVDAVVPVRVSRRW